MGVFHGLCKNSFSSLCFFNVRAHNECDSDANAVRSIETATSSI